DQRPVSPVDLDAVISKVGHVDTSAAHGDPERCAQVARARARGAPGGQRAAVGTKALQAIVELVDDVQRVALVECHAKGCVELAKSVARAAPLGQYGPF